MDDTTDPLNLRKKEESAACSTYSWPEIIGVTALCGRTPESRGRSCGGRLSSEIAPNCSKETQQIQSRLKIPLSAQYPSAQVLKCIELVALGNAFILLDR